MERVTNAREVNEVSPGLGNLLSSSLETWDSMHNGDSPDLLLIGVTDGAMVPTARFEPRPEALRQIAAALLDVADQLDQD